MPAVRPDCGERRIIGEVYFDIITGCVCACSLRVQKKRSDTLAIDLEPGRDGESGDGGRSVAGGGPVGPGGPRTGDSSGVLPGSSSGRAGSPGSRTGGGTSGCGLPGGIPGGGSLGVPGVAGGISGGSIGIRSRPCCRCQVASRASIAPSNLEATTNRALRRSCARYPGVWQTASMLWPSGSSTNPP